uniref:Uncharacterized protein n=1 Tax=Fagus sylvatica TaxID=28930 RepID=A0A2N9G9Z9_FAGSY
MPSGYNSKDSEIRSVPRDEMLFSSESEEANCLLESVWVPAPQPHPPYF